MSRAKGYRKRELRPGNVASVKLPVLNKADGIEQEDFYKWLNNKANNTSFNRTVTDLLKLLYLFEKELQEEAADKIKSLANAGIEDLLGAGKTIASSTRRIQNNEQDLKEIVIEKEVDVFKPSNNENTYVEDENIPDIDDIQIFRHVSNAKKEEIIKPKESEVDYDAIRKTLNSIRR